MKAFGSNGQKVRVIDGAGRAIATGYHLPLATDPARALRSSRYRSILTPKRPQRRFLTAEEVWTGETHFDKGQVLYLLDGDRFEVTE